MCIIAAKPRGVEMPNEDTLLNMWRFNSDGAGLMYAADGLVHIEKGFMKYDDFENCLNRLKKKYDLKRLPMVMHFRIATHGGTCKANCHPFPVTDSIGKLKKTNQVTNLGVAHNGVIDITTRKDISDTMEYIASQLAPLSKGVPKFYENKHLMQMVQNATDSKLAFMTGKGNIYYIGDFIEDGGIMYSNSSYNRTTSWRDFTYGSFAGDSWECCSGMKQYGYIPVMWLDESKGEYVKLADGRIGSEDYAISRYGTVYGYDYDEDGLKIDIKARAFNSEGLPLRYNERSPLTTEEIVIYDL